MVTVVKTLHIQSSVIPRDRTLFRPGWGEEFEQGLDSVFMDSITTAELDVSFDNFDTIACSVSSRFCHLISMLEVLNQN